MRKPLMVETMRRDELQDEVEALRLKVAALLAAHSASFKLTAELAQMAPGYEAGEAEYLNREHVMELVVAWRTKVDAAMKPCNPKGGV